MRKILLFIGIVSCVCISFFVDCSSMSVLKVDTVLAIKSGVTNKEQVVKMLGKPIKIIDNEFIYLYGNSEALKGKVRKQETHVFFDSAGIVSKTSFVHAVQGGGIYDLSAVQRTLIPLRVGKTLIDSVKEMLYPSILVDYYENGALQFKALQYQTAMPESRAFANLRHVNSMENEDGNFSYEVFFTVEGVLKKK